MWSYLLHNFHFGLGRGPQGSKLNQRKFSSRISELRTTVHGKPCNHVNRRGSNSSWPAVTVWKCPSLESFGVPFLGTGLLWKSRRQKARGAVARVSLERVSCCTRVPLLEVDAGTREKRAALLRQFPYSKTYPGAFFFLSELRPNARRYDWLPLPPLE